MTAPPDRADAVVIGAGLGGLSAAILLASTGKRVVICEAHAQPGGKAGAISLGQTASGEAVMADTGPSVLTLPGVFDKVVGAAGHRLVDLVQLRQPEPAFRYLFPDGVQLDLHHAVERTLESVRSTLGAHAAAELDGYLDYASRIWEAAAPSFVLGPAPTLSQLLSLGPTTWASARHIDPLRTMQAAIHKRVADPHLRAVLARYATYNGSDPRQAPATLNCIAHVELALGGYGITGGIQALVLALVHVAEAQGVELVTRCPVERIAVEQGRVVGVETAQGAIHAPVVVANADVAHVATSLLPDVAAHAIAPTKTPSMSGWTALLRASRATATGPRVAHTVCFPDDYDQEFVDIFDRDRPPQDPTVYVCDQSVCHGRPGWEAHIPLFAMANAPAEPASGSRDPEVWHRLEVDVRRRAHAAGVLRPTDEVLWRRTPTDLAHAYPGSRGAIYGASSNDRFAAFKRPTNRVRAVPGLYLASGGAHPGGGMPLAALSGMRAAEAALEDHGDAPIPAPLLHPAAR